MAFTEPNPNDDFNDDDQAEYYHERAAVVADMMSQLEEKASSDLGLYAQRQASLQLIPGTNDWAVQMTFQIGDRAYRKLNEGKREEERVIEVLEAEMVADDILRELREGTDGDE